MEWLSGCPVGSCKSCLYGCMACVAMCEHGGAFLTGDPGGRTMDVHGMSGMCGEAAASTLPRIEVHRWVCTHCAACAPRKRRNRENDHYNNEH